MNVNLYSSQRCVRWDGGCLGIKNSEAFNIALLAMWRWRMLVDTDSIRHNFLKYRYGNLSEAIMNGEDEAADNKQSLCGVGNNIKQWSKLVCRWH